MSQHEAPRRAFILLADDDEEDRELARDALQEIVELPDDEVRGGGS